MRRARILLVAANDFFLDGVVDCVAGDARIEVVGRACSGAQALERVESLEAEVVLVDVTLPDMSGFDVARRIKSRPDAPMVIMSSFHDSRDSSSAHDPYGKSMSCSGGISSPRRVAGHVPVGCGCAHRYAPTMYRSPLR